MSIFDRISRLWSGNGEPPKMEVIHLKAMPEMPDFELHRFSRDEMRWAIGTAYESAKFGTSYTDTARLAFEAVASYRREETKRKARSRKQNMVESTNV